MSANKLDKEIPALPESTRLKGHIGQADFIRRNPHLFTQEKKQAKEKIVGLFLDLCEDCQEIYGKHSVDCQYVARQWVEIFNAHNDPTDGYYDLYELQRS